MSGQRPTVAVHLLLLVLLPAAADAQSDGTGATPVTSWERVDGVALQAGDEIVTDSELRRLFERGRGSRDISTPEDFRREWSEAAKASMTIHLEAQAGEDLGLDSDQVQRLIRWQLEDQKREVGTATFRENLEQRGIDPQLAAEDQRQELLTYLWRSTKTGRTTALGARPTRDEFIRPGELRSIYEVNAESLVEPDKVRLQICGILAAAAGGLEAGRALAEEVRRRAAAGEEFGALVLEFGDAPGDGRGLTAPIPVPAIADPRLKAFAAEARPGEISPVLETRDDQGRQRFLVCRLHDRQEGPPVPPFEDRTVQRFLRRRIEDTREKSLLGGARERLVETAYLWTDPEIVPPVPEASVEGPEAGPAGPR